MKTIISIDKAKEIDYNSSKIKSEIAEIQRQNKELIEAKKPDFQKMNIPFDI